MQPNSIYKIFACTLLMFQTTRTMDNLYESDSAKQLIEAIQTDDFTTVSELLKLGLDPNVSFISFISNSKDRVLPIEVAIHHGHQICQLLISAGAQITPRAFNLAAQSGLLPIIQLFLKSGVDVNSRNNFLDRTPLIAAAWSGKEYAPEICELLISAGAHVNAKTKPFGAHSHPITALGGAVKGGNPKNIPLLLDAGADALELFAHHLRSEKIISLLAKQHPTLIASCVFIPDYTTRKKSQKRILTFLVCCRHIKPSLPRDIQTFILTKLSTTDLGNCMITQKIRGRPIPFFAQKATVNALYDSTLTLLKTEIPERLPKNFEARYGEQLRKNIIARLAQPNLLCNNPSGVLETKSIKEPAQNSNKNE